MKKTTSNFLEKELEKIICTINLTTQSSILEALEERGFETPDQSTVSRTLKKLGVVKIRDNRTGNMIYRWPPKKLAIAPPKSVMALVREIMANETMIVVHTDPGSASLVARYLDVHKPAGIIGTLAGDDTVFIVPKTVKENLKTLQELRAMFHGRD